MADTIDRQQSHHHLIASDRVEGTAVYNHAGERLGTIKNFMVDKVSGRAEFAVMQFGGAVRPRQRLLSHSMGPAGLQCRQAAAMPSSSTRRASNRRRATARPAAGHDNDYADMVRSYCEKQSAPFI